MIKQIETQNNKKHTKSKSQQKKRQIHQFMAQREQQWNSRVITGERILGDSKYSMTLSATKSSKKQTRMFPDISSQTQQIVQRYIKMQQQDQSHFETIQENQIKIQEIQLLEQIRSLWIVYNIPLIHQELFQQLLNIQKLPLKLLEEELRQLDNKQSPIQHATYAITARERCFNVLFAFLTSKSQESEDYFLKAQELIQHYRILTVLAYEGILKWQQFIESKSDGWQVEFRLDSGSTFTEILLRDSDQLKQILQDYFEVSQVQDPFFLSLITEEDRRAQKAYYDNLIKRIRILETSILVSQFNQQSTQLKAIESSNATQMIIEKEMQSDGTVPPPKQSD